MKFSAVTIILSILNIAAFALFIFMMVLILKALLKSLKRNDMQAEMNEGKQSLGKTLKAHRIRCKMTQEFVAETIGVSRQAVSKWELGTSDPSTSNLFALAKLYGVTAEELLKDVSE